VFMRGRYAALLMGIGIIVASVITFSPKYRALAERALDWAGQRSAAAAEAKAAEAEAAEAEAARTGALPRAKRPGRPRTSAASRGGEA